jgi:hypothetical protein
MKLNKVVPIPMPEGLYSNQQDEGLDPSLASEQEVVLGLFQREW